MEAAARNGADKPKTALLSHVMPPSPSGQSRVLGMLLDDDRAGEVLLLSDDRAALAQSPLAQAPLPFENHFLLPLPQLPGLRHINKVLGLLRGRHVRARQIMAALAGHDVKALVACTGSILNPPAAALAAGRLGIPMVLYLFDSYRHQWPPGIYKQFAARWERAVVQSAAALIAPNEFLAQEYAEGYGVKPVIVRNPFPEPAENRYKNKHLSLGEPLKIVYTGAVYDAHFDAFINLTAALRQCRRRAEIHIYADQDLNWLKRNGIDGPLVRHPHVSQVQALRAQQEADILFLPLGFATPKDRAVRTSAPGKLGEYLASGVPVLLHAPKDSFLAHFFNEHGCGLVADSPDPAELAGAVERLAADAGLRERLADNALKASAQFSLPAARQAFWSLLDNLTCGK